MATLTITNLTAAPVLVQELYAFVPANGTLTTDRTQSDIEGMTSFLASVVAGDLSYTLVPTQAERDAGLLIGAESVVNLGAPVAADTTGVHAAVAGTAANEFPGPITNPDVPRALQAAFGATWDGGDLTIVGTDQFGNAQTEVIADAPGTTVVGAAVFATVTSITKQTVGIDAATASVGVGSILGLQQLGDVNMLFADGVSEAGTFDLTEVSVDPTTAPNGTVVFSVLKA